MHVGLLIVATVMGLTNADPPPESPDFKPDNAAYWYRQAHAELESLSHEDLEAIYEYLNSPASTPPSNLVLDVIQRSNKAIDLLQKGAQRDSCDYQLDYSQGIDLLLPNLGELRKASRLLAADARIQISKGNPSDAVDRLTAGYQLANHLANDSLIISSLVSMSVFKDIDQHTQTALDRAIFGPTECDRLLDVTQSLRERDFNVAESLATEQVMISDWVINEFEDPDATEISFNDLGIDPLTLTRDSLVDDLRGYDQAMDELMVIFQEDDPLERERKLSEWSDFLEGGGHGQLAPILAGALDGVIKSVVASNQQLDERISTLHAIAAGQVKAEDKVNAALVYKEAFTAFEQIPPEHRSVMKAMDPGARYRDPTTLPMNHFAPSLALFAKAAALRQCDFSVLLNEPSAPFGPWYAAAMRDGIRAMLLRASYQLAHGRVAKATTDLEAAYRMIHHLSDDHRLLSAMVAQQSMREANRILARIMIEENEEHNFDRLRITVTGLPKADPFGYIGGLREDRSKISYWTAPSGQVAPNISGANILRFMAIIDTLARAGTTNKLTQWTAVDSLPRVIDLAALEEVRLQTPQLAMLIQDRESQMIIDADLPLIADVHQQQQTGRSDLRQAWSILRRRDIVPDPAIPVSE